MTLSRILTLATVVLTVAACSDKSTGPSAAPPVITLTEVGEEIENTAIVGEDLHLEAEIEAEGRIETVQLRIAQQTGKTYSRPWSLDVTWDQYRGETDAHVHKHVDIPADAPIGTYDLVMIVKDQKGKTAQVRRDLQIIAAAE